MDRPGVVNRSRGKARVSTVNLAAGAAFRSLVRIAEMAAGLTLPMPLPASSIRDECRGEPGRVMVGALAVPIWMKRIDWSLGATLVAAAIISSALGPHR